MSMFWGWPMIGDRHVEGVHDGALLVAGRDAVGVVDGLEEALHLAAVRAMSGCERLTAVFGGEVSFVLKLNAGPLEGCRGRTRCGPCWPCSRRRTSTAGATRRRPARAARRPRGPAPGQSGWPRR